MSDLKYSQVLNYILKTIYDLRKLSSDHYLSMPAILDVLHYKATFFEATEIAEYFETKGFASIINTIGDILIQITPVGKLHVEELSDKFNDDFKKYMDQLTIKKGEEIQLELYLPEENPKNKVITLIDEIRKELISKIGDDSDYIRDVDIIKLELSKVNPDFRIIELKIDEINNTNFAIENIRELRNYIVHARQ